MAKTKPGDLLTLQEAAAVAHVPLETMRYWTRFRGLKTIKPGRRRMVRRLVLEAFLDEKHEPRQERKQAEARNQKTGLPIREVLAGQSNRPQPAPYHPELLDYARRQTEALERSAVALGELVDAVHEVDSGLVLAVEAIRGNVNWNRRVGIEAIGKLLHRNCSQVASEIRHSKRAR